ncbi:MAG: UDP-N-acetylmuramoyl-tripeptide--D-alanyl-D-alanine ligase [Firmicutes bacterium]|nr:UDP-N-acetylmuramoyl-tripeptide--D-alanyl-D-alanine ligase [Bacillota bacterium]
MGWFLLSLIPFLFYGILKTKKILHILQQNWYNDGNRYINWIKNNVKKVFYSFDALFVIFVLGLILPYKYLLILFIAFYVVSFVLLHKKSKLEQVKKPLVVTARIKRLIMTSLVFYAIAITVMCLTFDEKYVWLYYLGLGLTMYLQYIYLYLVNIVNKPIEKQVFYHFRRQAVKKLKSMSNMSVVGITGSYGKTSSKNILSDILNIKFNAFPTPKNFNTTYGMINTINNYLDKFNDIFIAEMGAFKVGEIQEICDLVRPKYGILTTIGTAHLESFGNRENIQKGKFELIESLPSDGVGVLNGDDPYQLNYQLKNNCKILWIGIDNKDVDFYAENIKLSNKGMEFDVKIKGDKTKYHFATRLLGRANIYNILSGIALGYYLGISMEDLYRGVKKVNSIEHRLELKKMGNINIIDDAYNSNPVGSKMALDVLNLMPGKKIIVTPGMIELGAEQYNLNFEFGTYIADICDEVILIGREQTKPIFDGLESKKYNKKHIHILQDVRKAFPLMRSLGDDETYVLLENDLPDIFNE